MLDHLYYYFFKLHGLLLKVFDYIENMLKQTDYKENASITYYLKIMCHIYPSK